MRANNLVLLLAVSLAAPATRPATVPTELAKTAPSFAWPAPDQEQRIAADVSRAQMSAFWESVSEELWGFRSELDEFAFVRCSANRATLVATFCVNGWSNSLAVVDWDGTQTRVHQFSAGFKHDLDDAIVDVDGDGLVEIVTHELVLDQGGASTKLVVWSQIFKARADYTLEDVSARNRAYYEKVIIPELEELDGKLADRYEGTGLAEAKAQVQFVRDKYRRMLYGEREAGLNNALNWSRTAQRELQRLAIRALQDIGTKEAREEIVRLSEVSDGVVASAARHALYVMDAARP